MSKAQPSNHQSALNDFMSHEQLMDAIAAEDASNGEVGCGREWGKQLAVSLDTFGISGLEESLMALLQRHLAEVLREEDLDAIVRRVGQWIERLVLDAHSGVPVCELTQAGAEAEPHYVPDQELHQFLIRELGHCLETTVIEQMVQFTHQAIHQAVLRPRHTWPDPLWVLKADTTMYVAQAKTVEEAVAKVKGQYPGEMSALEPVKVGGVLAPNSVVSLEV